MNFTRKNYRMMRERLLKSSAGHDLSADVENALEGLRSILPKRLEPLRRQFSIAASNPIDTSEALGISPKGRVNASVLAGWRIAGSPCQDCHTSEPLAKTPNGRSLTGMAA